MELKEEIDKIKIKFYSKFLLLKLQLNQILHRKIVQKIYRNYLSPPLLSVDTIDDLKEIVNHLPQLASSISIKQQLNKIPYRLLHFLSYITSLQLNFNPLNIQYWENILQSEFDQNYSKKMKITHLKHLKFTLYDSSSCEVFSERLAASIKNLSSIQILDIHLKYQENSDQILLMFIKNLQSLKNLTHLNIHNKTLQFNEKSSDIFSKIFHIINTQLTLKQLNLFIGDHIFTQNFPQKEIKIHDLYRIQTIYNYKNVTEEKIQTFINILNKQPNLEKLTLSTAIYQYIDEDGNTKLYSYLKQAQNLKELTNIFPEQYIIKPQIYEIFSKSLYKLSNLQHLSLVFGSHNNLEPKACQYLQQAIQNLQNLTQFTLHIHSSNNVKPKGFSSLLNSIQKLQNLERIDLNLQKFGNNFSKKELEKIPQIIINSKKLKKINLQIPGLQEQTVQQIQEKRPDIQII